MAIEIEFKMTYENGVSFKMETKVDGGSWLTILYSEENTHFDKVSGAIQAVCLADFSTHLANALEVMKQP